jgi:hypothetical protein
MPEVDQYPLNDNDDLELEIEDDDDIHDGAARLFSIDLSDITILNDVINVIASNGGGGATMVTRTSSTSTHGTSSVGKRKSSVWFDFEEIEENGVRVAAIYKMCSKRLSTRSTVALVI